VSEQQPTEPTQEVSLSNAVSGDWDRAMEKFFDAVERERTQRGMTVEETVKNLKRGYGWDVAEEWENWSGENDD
jgi:hypothetical protein